MNTNKIGISGVVATALLLVVAVVSLVSFQTWYSSYSSELFADAEQQSSNQIAQTGVDLLLGDSLYFKNSQSDNISISEIKINNVNCNITGQFIPGVSKINVSSCVSNLTTQTPDIVIVTDDKIISEKVFVQDSNSQTSSLNQPAINLTLAGNFTWNITLNDSLNRIRKIKTDSNNNIILGGVAGLEYFYLGKFDTDGNHLWNISESSGAGREVRGVDVDSQDNIYVTYRDYSLYQIYLEKFSPEGNLLWNQTIYDGSSSFISGYATDLEVNSQNQVYVSSEIDDVAYIHKYDSNGNYLWNVSYNYVSQFGQMPQLGLDSNENPVILFSGVSNDFDFISIATDSDGNFLWDNVFDENSESEYPDDICTSSDGDIYMVGRTGGTNRYTKIVKYDINGNEIQNETIGIRLSGFLTADCDMFSNNDLLIHSVNYGNNLANFKRLNSSLDIIWEKDFTLGEDYGQLNAISIDNEDNIILGIKLSDSNVNFLGKID